MDRRGFLQRLIAAGTAMAAAAKTGEIAASFTPAPRALPAPAPAMPPFPPPPPRHLCDAQEQVIRLLDECCIVSYDQIGFVDGRIEHAVTYRQSEGSGLEKYGYKVPTSDGRLVPLEDLKDIGVPRSIEVAVQAARSVDVFGLGDPYTKIDTYRPVYEVKVTWIIP